MDTLSSVLPVIILLLIGVLCRKKRLIEESGIGSLQSLVMNITLPVGLFLTFFNASLTADTLAFPLTIFAVNALGYPLGKLLCRLFRRKDPFLPFAMTTSEDGMLGYALLAMIILESRMTAFALMDLGQVLGFFAVTYQILNKQLTGEKASLRSIVKSIVTNPLLVGMLAGILCSATGLSALAESAGLMPLIESLCSFISAPTNAVILIVIGYRINFSHLKPGELLMAMLMRMLQQGLLCAAVLTLFRFLGGVFAEPVTTVSVLAIMMLPGTYLLPMYVEPDERKEFYATFLSAYTLLSVAAFIVLKLLTAGRL